MRIAIGAFMYEANSFSPVPTTLDDFAAGTLVRGAAMLDHFRNTNTEVAGFLHSCAAIPAAEIIPLLAADANPAGPIQAATYVALRDEPDHDLDSTFLNLIDVLTPSHLRVLHMLQSTRAFATGQGTTVPITIDRSFHRVVEQLLPDVPLSVYTLIRTDLESRGLIITGSVAVAASRDPVDQRLTTALGDKFLSFISASVGDENSASGAPQAPSARSSLRDLAGRSLAERHRAVWSAGIVVDADETEVWDETAGDGIEE